MRESIVIRWVRERFGPRLAVPVVGGLCAIGAAAGMRPGTGRLALMALLATFLLLQFRLWDDLADVAADRERHPERTLPQAPSLDPFRTVCWCAAGASALLVAWLDPTGRKLAALCGLQLGLFGWYRFRPREFPLGYHVVLLKYPVFVYLLASEAAPVGGLLPAMASVYLAACIYETLHDAALRRIWAARYAAAVEVALLGAALLLGGHS